MDKIDEYRAIVRKTVEYYGSFNPSNGVIVARTLIIPEQDFYAVMHIGWDGYRRVHGLVIHIDIIGDKVWIQYDGTSTGVAYDLMDAGIPKQSIVLAWQPVILRKTTDFAIGE